MKTQKISPKRSPPPNKRAVSSVITTIVISAALLIILVIAAFVSTNILSIQLASTEFEQAKTNMALLNDVIQDVSLRNGAGGYVQFNERTGGIGLNQTSNTITIRNATGGVLKTWPSLFTLVYHASSQVSSAATNITGSSKLNTTMSEPIGFLRVETNPGVWIKLDFNRVRTVSMGNVSANGSVYEFYSVTFLNLVKDNISGRSGTVNVRVQNRGISTTSYVYEQGTNVTVQLNNEQPPKNIISTSSKTVVIITEILIAVSIN